MALDRTNFNAWVNDSGSNADGSVGTKQLFEDGILDPTDDEITRLDAADAAAAAGYAGLTSNGTKITAVAFPATQSASSDANTLDDYEEATTFTPVIGGSGGTSGQTYSVQAGQVLKIGKFVFFSAYVVFTAKGTITGNVQLQGLPFTSENTSNRYYVCNVSWLLPTTWASIQGILAPNATVVDIKGNATAATSSFTALTTTDINNATEIMVTGWYRASS